MKILLTGATGFLGSALLKALLKKNYEIIILKRSFSDTCRIKNELPLVKSYDLDKISIPKIFAENKNIKTIIHTATCYGRKKETVSQIFYSNTAFPLELLENAVENAVTSFLNTGTILPLAKRGYVHNYVLSKLQFIEWGKYYSSKIKFINTTLDYLYGPFDDRTKLLPVLIEACVRNLPEFNLSKGEQRRDFVYIDDAVSAYTKIIESDFDYESYDIGSGTQLSLKEAVLKVKELSKSNINLKFGAVPYREEEPMQLKTNPVNLFSLGWKPQYNFEDGIKKLIQEEFLK